MMTESNLEFDIAFVRCTFEMSHGMAGGTDRKSVV